MIARCHPGRRHHAKGLCRLCYQADAKAAWRAANPGRSQRVNVEKKYGISPEQYDAMFARQNGGCAVCGAPPGRRRLAVDHNHATGVVRGLLCSSCNTALGSLRDDPFLIRSLAVYVESRAA